MVTVLFAELVGFEEQADQADPEDDKATLLPFDARLKQVIEHFGGRVDKFIGDVVLGGSAPPPPMRTTRSGPSSPRFVSRRRWPR